MHQIGRLIKHAIPTIENMNVVFKVFLFLHILGGTVGLLSGLINILRTKGDKKHQSIGRVFFMSMLTTGVTSLVLAFLHSNHFLMMVGVFTLYMVISGQRYLKLKQSDKIEPKLIEWTITLLLLVAGLLFLGIGFVAIVKSNLFGIVYLSFGGLGLLFVLQDFKNYNDKTTIKNTWLIGHLQRMTGSFIASFTAFLVVNAKYFPEQIPSFVYWLLPTIILTPLIIKWSRKYEISKK